VSTAEPHYEPEVIERFAARLERRATSLRNGFTATGVVLGAAFGAVPLTPLGVAWPIPELFGFATLLVGAALGGLIGYVVGDGRGELHRLHAQTTLCQLHAQRATVAIWRLLREREDTRPAPVERTAPVPTPAPAPAPPPAPVAPPAPAPVVAAAPAPLLAPPSPVAPPPPVAVPAPIVATAPPVPPAEPPVAPAPPLSEPPIAAAPLLEEPSPAPAPPLTSPPPLRAAPPIQAPPVSA
jgi:hypothetical protein